MLRLNSSQYQQSELVILVDEFDNELGHMEKMEAHEKALLHRAFSVFVFNAKNEMLLHQRAVTKYHSGGLWTNACCSHPREGESTEQAARRRLHEEMGFDCEIEEQFAFIYKAELDQGLTEHEFDHVFTGTYEGEINPNPEEVQSYRYVSLQLLQKELNEYPAHFTEWFKIAIKQFLPETVD
jgi:isopentenyl-diphosphate Delta-isomerase